MAKSKCRRKNKSKASKAACKGVRTRKRKAAARSASARKSRRRSARKHTRKPARRSAPRRTTRKPRRHRKSAKRVAAGRKAAVTRRMRSPLGQAAIAAGGFAGERRRRRGSKRRRKNPIAAEAAETPKRRKRAKRRRSSKRALKHTRKPRRARRHNRRPHRVRAHMARRKGRRTKVRVRAHYSRETPRKRRRNPIDGGMETLSSLLGVAAGFLFAGGLDRLSNTHALNASGQDAPAQGDIYNSESVSLPIWSSWMRIGAAVASIGAPLWAASMTTGGWRSFFQLAGFAAIGRTVGKAAEDGMAQLATVPRIAQNTTVAPILQRLYAPELAALQKQSGSNVAALNAASPGTFAGLPKLPAKRQMGLGSDCAPCDTIGQSTVQTPNDTATLTEITTSVPPDLLGTTDEGSPVSEMFDPLYDPSACCN